MFPVRNQIGRRQTAEKLLRPAENLKTVSTANLIIIGIADLDYADILLRFFCRPSRVRATIYMQIFSLCKYFQERACLANLRFRCKSTKSFKKNFNSDLGDRLYRPSESTS